MEVNTGDRIINSFAVPTDASGQTPFQIWEAMFGVHPKGEIQLWRKLPEPRFTKRHNLIGVEEMVSTTLSEMRAILPEIRDSALLWNDVYFTVNLFYPQARHWPHPETGLPLMRRTEDMVHQLVNAYVDLDVGRVFAEARGDFQMLSWRQAAAFAGDMMDKGILPQASFFANSGRGGYSLWTIRDEQDPSKLLTLPPPFGDARDERQRIIGLYKRINKEFAKRLREAAADPINDAARYLRVPQSFHSKTGKQVVWQKQYVNGQMPHYTLPQLAKWAGIPLVEPTRPYQISSADHKLLPQPERQRRTTKPGTVPNRVKGKHRLGQMRSDDIALIEGFCGGFPEGMREGTILRYSDALRTAGLPFIEVRRKAEEMAARCKPTYPSHPNDPPVIKLVEQAFALKRRYRTENLVTWFGVTPEQAKELDLAQLLPKEVKRQRDAERPKRLEIREQRRALVDDMVLRNQGRIPGIRSLRDMCARCGFKASFRTIRQDLLALGYKLSRAGRPKSEKSPVLPLTP